MTRREYIPRPWQEPMLRYLLDNDRCALWATMGAGKTSPALTALRILKLAGELDEPALAIGPLRVARDVWPDEAREWAHLRDLSVQPIIGDPKSRAFALRQKADLYTVNYEMLGWLVDYLGDAWPFRTILADESTRIKSWRGGVRKNGRFDVVGANCAKALARVAWSKVNRLWEFTGTPSPNGLNDLWGQSWYMDKGERLGTSYGSFRQRWFQKSFDGYAVDPLPYAQEQIQDALRDICLTVDIADYIDIKKPIINNIYVDLPPRARALYREMEKEMYIELDGRTAEAFNAAARTQKLLQLANGAVYVDPLADTDENPRSREWRHVHDEKLDALASVVEEAAGMPIMVAYQFRSDIARIQRAFPKAVDLSISSCLENFKQGRAPLGLAHPKSLGHGINGLPKVTNILAFFGHDWNLELYDQIIGRIDYIRQFQAGLDRPLYIHHILARDTADELVRARRETKRSVQDLLIDSMKRRYG
jgi:SNF2 family DNA or RNA helicase